MKITYLNENALFNLKLFEETSDRSKKRRSVPCDGIKEKKGFSCYEELKYGKGTGKFYKSLAKKARRL